MTTRKKHIHFMGIGGSALAGVAILAKKAGFKVTGCDLSKGTYYSESLRKEKIKVYLGHDNRHLKGVDIVAASPAIFDVSPDNPEVIEAKKKGILMTWQKFMGRYLQKNKFVIAIAGTHGKSTTTTLTGLVLEEAGLDPIVEVGAIVSDWEKTVRPGKSSYFVCEADEFNYNFLNYSPSIEIINNIEMDHPEFFKNFDEFKGSFEKFIQKLVGPKILIINEESQGIRELVLKMKKWLKENKVKVIGYYFDKNFEFPFSEEYAAEILATNPDFSLFRVKSRRLVEEFSLRIPGIHNVANCLGVWACARELGISSDVVRRVFQKFSGIGRRFSLAGEKKGIKVFDDYAVHPTAVRATFQAAKQKFPSSRIWLVFEPHQYSRLNLFLDDFSTSLKLANRVIVTKPYPGREIYKGKPNVEELIFKIGKKASYIPNFEDVANQIAKEAKSGDVVIVLGAGKSYDLSQTILKRIGSS